MKRIIQSGSRILTTLLLAVVCFQTNPAHAQTTAFTYQGQLTTPSGNANGSYDLSFSLYDANVAGNFITGPVTNSAVAVSNGLFTVTLNFGAGVFTGTNYWAEIGVRTNGGGAFVTLVPRQQLTPVPTALSLVAQSPQANALCPVGSIMAYMGTNAPDGWLLCNGLYVSRTTYSNLYAIIGTSSGSGGGGSTTFRLPDTRGLFLRGWNAGTTRDPDAAARTIFDTGGNAGDAVGSYQADELKSHRHGFVTAGSAAIAGAYPAVDGRYLTVDQFQGPEARGIYNTGIELTGGSETRPKNVYVNYIIKY